MTIDWNDFLSTEAKLRVSSVMKTPAVDNAIYLLFGLPHPDCFPVKSLSIDYLTPESDFKKTSTLKISDGDDGKNNVYEALQYMNSKGTSFLREWCLQHIKNFHKPSYDDWDFLIQAGATQSTDSIVRTLCDPGDSVLVDNFTYPCFVETCKPLRVGVCPVDIDTDGASPEDMDRILTNWSTGKFRDYKKPKLYYAVPVGQNPLGYTMSKKRRLDILKVCQKHNLLVLEDDPYFHLQLKNEDGSSPEPVSSFLKLDTDGRVIRIDSFSKMLMPGVRTSIITANKLFIEKLLISNELSIHTASGPSQLLLYKVLSTWHNDHDNGFGQWLDRLQSHYQQRRDHLLHAFETHVPKDLCFWNKPVSGMFIWLEVRPDKFPKLDDSKTDGEWCIEVENMIFDSCLKNCVALAKGHWFMVDQTVKRIGFRASYAFPEEEEFLKSGERVGTAVKEVHKKLYGK